MKSEIPYRRFSFARHNVGMLILCLIGLLFCGMPQKALAQDRLQGLYDAQAIQKHKIKSIEVELYAFAAAADTAMINSVDPDYREKLFFDAEGRPMLYEATDINIRNKGTAGPHILSHYEYSDSGGNCHRHDSTVFGRSSEWHFRKDALGRAVEDQMFLPDLDVVSIEREYLYDEKGRLNKTKTNRNRSAEGLKDDCSWIFYVHDNLSFNATSLSPQDMARCRCSLEYLDDFGRSVRRAIYDTTGVISETMLLTYDRTDKPVRLESRDGSGKQLKAWVDLVYGRNGLVILEVNGIPGLELWQLGTLSTMAQSWVMENWADWRLLRELRIKMAGRETSRFIFSYDQQK